MKVQEKKSQKHHIRWMLVCYDVLIYLISAILLLVLYGGMDRLTTAGIAEQMIISMICIFSIRMFGKIYNQVWRYGGIQCYMRLIFTDGIQSASTHGKVKYSATRFGNVLGSAGSVIPLFKRQIANGGPVTITDKRIIRYFMTIPEASQLVLQSGAMAKNGELFVLDMGKPVKIMDLAENMIRLAGVHGIEIVETGLRPGEKLYEELLVKTEELDKTENSMIFIERDTALSTEEIDKRLALLREACVSDDDLKAKKALRKAVPTFKTPEEVNRTAFEKNEKENEEKQKKGLKVALF